MYSSEQSSTDQSSSYALVCNKQDMLLEVDKANQTYSLNFNLCSKDKLNIDNFLTFKIYELIEKLNPDLIEKIDILNVKSESEADILFKFTHIAKEVGIKQKYMLLNTKKSVSDDKKTIVFNSKSTELTPEQFITYKLRKFDRLYCEFADLRVNIDNIEVKIHYHFKILQNEQFPIYMENLIGLMMKKIFYNIKQFIEKMD